MEELHFSTNWNGTKLNVKCECGQCGNTSIETIKTGKLNNQFFTSIRLHNPKKYITGFSYVIILNDKPHSIAVLNRVLATADLRSIDDHIYMLDTGYSKIQSIDMLVKMYQNRFENVLLQKFDVLLFKHERYIV